MEKPIEAVSKAVYLPISIKETVEVCHFLRGRTVKRALTILERVTQLKEAIPYFRYNKGGVGHKAGYGPGRYPVNVCKVMIKLVKDVQANADQKGMNKENLVISRMLANKGPNTYHYGRHRGHIKRTHIEIAVTEQKETKKAAPKKTEAKK
jgi:large subunit ribosomal protein L22